MTRYHVHIVERSTGAVAMAMTCRTLRQAESTKRGAEINLNHSDYRVDIIATDPSPKA